jgi:hypothetical protein
MSASELNTIKELFDVKLSALKAEVMSCNDITRVQMDKGFASMGLKLDEIIDHQKRTNGRVTELENIAEGEKEYLLTRKEYYEDKFRDIENRTKLQEWVRAHPVKFIGGVLLTMAIVSVIADTLGIAAIVKVFKWW